MKTTSFSQQSRVFLGLFLALLAALFLIVSCENFNGPKSGQADTTGTGGGTGGGMGGGGTGGGGTGGGGTTQCDTANVSFASSVKPILENNCTTCHTGASGNAGVDLSTFNGVTAVVNRGRIFPRVLTASGGAQQMPPGSRLTACDINKIVAWVNQGARNN